MVMFALAVVAWLVVVAPAVLLGVQIARHRDGAAPPLRRSATVSGIGLLLLAAMTPFVPEEALPGPLGIAIERNLVPIAFALAVLGAIVIALGWAAPWAPRAAPVDWYRRTERGIASGLFVAFVITNVVPAFRGTSLERYDRTAARGELRYLVTLQEHFFADSGRYTTSVASLQFRPGPFASPPVITVGADWWVATTVYQRRVRRYVCGVAVDTINPVVAGAPNGDPACVY